MVQFLDMGGSSAGSCCSVAEQKNPEACGPRGLKHSVPLARKTPSVPPGRAVTIGSIRAKRSYRQSWTESGVVFGQRSTTRRAACPKTTPDPFSKNIRLRADTYHTELVRQASSRRVILSSRVLWLSKGFHVANLENAGAELSRPVCRRSPNTARYRQREETETPYWCPVLGSFRPAAGRRNAAVGRCNARISN